MAKPKPIQITTTDKGEREVIPFTIDDATFQFRVTKQWSVISNLIDTGEQVSIASIVQWLKDGLSDEDWQTIEDRLNDSDDNLDLPELSELVKQLLEAVAQRPSS